MPLFEYSEWDGSQQFQPLSADALFDRVAEYLLEHGDYVLRHLEKLDRDDADCSRCSSRKAIWKRTNRAA